MADPIVIAAGIAALGTVGAAVVSTVASVRSNRQLKPSNGTTIATMVERTDRRAEAIELEVKKLTRTLAHHLAIDHGLLEESHALQID